MSGDIPQWHRFVFEMIPVVILLTGFFLSLRSRLDRIEVRVQTTEHRLEIVEGELAKKQDSSQCAFQHSSIGQSIAAMQVDIRALTKQVFDLATLIRANGNGKNGGHQ